MEKEEKLLSAHVESSLIDQFLGQAEERGFKKKRVLAGAVRLWVSLPPEIQAKLLNESLTGDSFLSLVQEIVDERMEAGKQAARALVEHQKRKSTRKG